MNAKSIAGLITLQIGLFLGYLGTAAYMNEQYNVKTMDATVYLLAIIASLLSTLFLMKLCEDD